MPHTTPHRPRRQQWRPGAAIAALALAAMIPACMTSPQNGTTVTGSNVGRSLSVSGFSPTAGSTVTVQVLDTPDLGAYDGTGTWATLGTFTAASSPYPTSNPPMYLWSGSVVPVASAAQEHRWPATGLVKIRALESGFPVLTFDPEGIGCILNELGNGATWDAAGLTCASPSSPVVAILDIDPVPTGEREFLTGITYEHSIAEAYEYYRDIDAGPGMPRSTFNGWLQANGFNTNGTPVPGEVNAVYYNAGDLGLGRNMNCREQGGGKVACYVTNYGGNFGEDAAYALPNAIAETGAVATVAMEYHPTADHDKVRFFVYNHIGLGVNGNPYASGEIMPEVALDNDGAKNVPGVCLSCHAGTEQQVVVTRLDDGGLPVGVLIEHNINDARFLPFDPFTFVYSTDPGYTLSDQQEALRKLNAMVKSTPTTTAMDDLIDGLYAPGLVTSPGALATNSHIPTGWAGSDASQTLYTQVVKPYCRTCHVAMGDQRAPDFLDYNEFVASKGAIQYYACEESDMPYAELTQRNFWESPARAHLTGILQLTGSCESKGRPIP